jgi:hypothetical protein
VQLVRRIDKTIKSVADQTSPIERGIVVHGNRFIMHCILRKIGKSGNISNSETIKDDVIDEAVKGVLASINEIIEKSYPDAYLAPLFKNVKKCTDIRSQCESNLG